MKEENLKLEKLFQSNGIGLPPAPPKRTRANLEEIPVDARFSILKLVLHLYTLQKVWLHANL